MILLDNPAALVVVEQPVSVLVNAPQGAVVTETDGVVTVLAPIEQFSVVTEARSVSVLTSPSSVTVVTGAAGPSGNSDLGVVFSATPPLNPQVNDLWIRI